MYYSTMQKLQVLYTGYINQNVIQISDSLVMGVMANTISISLT